MALVLQVPDRVWLEVVDGGEVRSQGDQPLPSAIGVFRGRGLADVLRSKMKHVADGDVRLNIHAHCIHPAHQVKPLLLLVISRDDQRHDAPGDLDPAQSPYVIVDVTGEPLWLPGSKPD